MIPNSCKICGYSDTELQIRAESKRYAPGEYFQLYQCNNCSGTYIYPPLTFDELQKYYPTDYQPHKPNQTKTIYPRKIVMDSVRQWVYGCRSKAGTKIFNVGRRVLSGIFDLLTYRSLPWPIRDGKLLDIGCGSGAYLMMLEDLGWSGYGIESNIAAAGHANCKLGLKVKSGDFEAADYPPKYFDVITMWHSLEHFSDPKKVIRKARLLLKDDGELLIGLPNYSSLDRGLFKESWNGMEIPIHVFHFTPKSIQRLLTEAGFKVKKIVHTTRPTDMMKSIINFIEDKYQIKPNKSVATLFFLISIPFSLYCSLLRRSSIIKVFAS